MSYELTDAQFNKILDRVDRNSSDHDLLVQIATRLEFLSSHYEEDKQRVAVNIAEVKKMAGAAHERIDAEVKFRLVLTGCAVALGSIVGLVGLILRLTDKM